MHTGTVREWFPEGGWGVLDCVDTPGGCWAHFSAVVMIGYRELIPGDSINFTFESGPQDGYDFRAAQVWPPGVDPGTSEPSPPAIVASRIHVKACETSVACVTVEAEEAKVYCCWPGLAAATPTRRQKKGF